MTPPKSAPASSANHPTASNTAKPLTATGRAAATTPRPSLIPPRTPAIPGPDIFDYTDYRLYLQAWVAHRKATSRAFSFRQFAAKAATAPSLLRDILSNRRRLTLDVMRKYAAAMQLAPRQLDYMETLVRFQHSHDNEERNECFDRMMQVRLEQRMRFLDPSQYLFWTKWYFSAVRELSTLPAFREDPAWIASHLLPSISVVEARESIATLLELGLLKRDAQGKLRTAEPVVSSEYEICSLAVRSFHAQMIDLAKQSLERVPLEHREVSSLTLGLTEKTFRRIKQKVRIFKEQVLSMVESDPESSEMVAQFNFQLFPLAQVTPRPEAQE